MSKAQNILHDLRTEAAKLNRDKRGRKIQALIDDLEAELGPARSASGQRDLGFGSSATGTSSATVNDLDD